MPKKNISFTLCLGGLISLLHLFPKNGNSQNNNTPLDSALVACFKFSGNANDNSGNNNNGTVIGALLVSDRNGIPNAAYHFNGTNQNIQVPNLAGQITGSEFAISFWATSMFGGTRSAFIMDPDNDYNRLNVHIYYSSQTFWDFGDIYNNGRLGLTGGLVPAANTWDHWVFISTGRNGGSMTCYKNGTLLGSKTGSSVFVNNQAMSLLIGGGYGPGNTHLWFEGGLDDIKIFKRALTQNDVTSLFTSTFSCQPCEDCTDQQEELGEDRHTLIYPNPSNGEWHLALKNAGKAIRISVYNSRGQLISESNDLNGKMNYSFEKLNPGLYLIRIEQELKTILLEKLLVQ